MRHLTNYGASLGTVSLKTGRSKWFNIYETWGEDTTYEIYEMENGTFRLFATAGTSPISKVGDYVDRVDLQGKVRHFGGRMVDFAVGTQLKELVSKYGPRMLGYTYK